MYELWMLGDKKQLSMDCDRQLEAVF